MPTRKKRSTSPMDHLLAHNRTFSPDRTLEETAGVTGEDRKRAVDANRTGGGERSETVPKPASRKR